MYSKALDLKQSDDLPEGTFCHKFKVEGLRNLVYGEAVVTGRASLFFQREFVRLTNPYSKANELNRTFRPTTTYSRSRNQCGSWWNGGPCAPYRLVERRQRPTRVRRRRLHSLQ
jgi:hypothetical protein